MGYLNGLRTQMKNHEESNKEEAVHEACKDALALGKRALQRAREAVKVRMKGLHREAEDMCGEACEQLKQSMDKAPPMLFEDDPFLIDFWDEEELLKA